MKATVLVRFLSYYPLKQGLKQLTNNFLIHSGQEFLSYYPLKQGLKQDSNRIRIIGEDIFILLSIKTRIETVHGATSNLQNQIEFLSYYPLKQGLKHQNAG